MVSDFEALGYNTTYKVLNGINFGVPQKRERVFIVGIRDDSDNTFTFPKEQHLTKKLKDILVRYFTDEYIKKQLVDLFSNDSDSKGSDSTISKKELEKILEPFLAVCDVLKTMHGSKLCHWDIKRENVLFSKSENLYKVCDFGSCEFAPAS